MSILSPKQVRNQLEQGLDEPDVLELEQFLRASFRAEELSRGWMRIEGETVLWAVELPGCESAELVTRKYTEDGSVWFEWEAPQLTPRPDLLASNVERMPMQRVGMSSLYVYVKDLPNFSATAFRVEAGGRQLPGSWVVLENFPQEPECMPQPGAPQGTVTEYVLRESSVFPGTVRGWWLYVPAQYRPGQPASLMVFQDGGMYMTPQAPAPTVFDNLIHQGRMPVTVGVFINPGTFPEQEGRFQNRGFEYDTLSGQYARFLRDDILPEVRKLVNIREDAASHTICGISSGAVCALNAAWEMPDLFGKVVSHCGSFTNIRGAHDFWTLIRKEERKPLRIFLQGGTNDIDDVCGSWYLANRQVEAALKFRSYDYKAVFGRGFHSLAHGGAIMPSTLEWLWR